MKTKQHIETRERILTRVEEMFLKFGYSKVTVDEIASCSGISKKTFYNIFLSKEELVRELILKMGYILKESIDDIFAETEKDFIEKLKIFMNLVRIQYIKFDGPLLEDLHKNIPDLWQQVNEFGEDKIEQYFIKLINMGVNKRIFVKDIDAQLTALIFLSAIKKLTNYEILAVLPLSGEQILDSILNLIINGIFTEEGRISYKAYRQED